MVQLLKSQVDALGFDFGAAVAAHAAALREHVAKVNEPVPTAHPLVEVAVRRERAALLTDDQAREQMIQHLCASLLPLQEANLKMAEQQLEAAHKRMSVVQKIKTKIRVGVDPTDAPRRAHMAASQRVQEMRRGVLPLQFHHLLPKETPPVHAGPDAFVPDYEIVDDVVKPREVTLADRKIRLFGEISDAERTAQERVMPYGSRRLFQMRVGKAMAKNPEDRDEGDRALLAEAESRQACADAISRHGAELMDQVESLTDETVGAWTMGAFP